MSEPTYCLLGIVELFLLPSDSLVLANVDIDTVDLLIIGRILGGVNFAPLQTGKMQLTLNRF